MARMAAALAALAVLTFGAPAMAQTPNLVARYHLDGAAIDSSGHGLDATPFGSPEGIVDGRFGTAFRFGDANDAFSAGSNPLLQPGAVTLAAWVRSATVPGRVKSIVSQGAQATCAFSSYSLYTGGSADVPGVRFYVWNGTAVAVTPPAPNTMWNGAWHMVAGTFDGTAVRLFLDGVEVGSMPASGSIGYGLTNNTFVIGNAPPSGCFENTSFSGDIDEVLVFDRALNATQIAALPAIPTPPPEPTPVPTTIPAPIPVPAPVPVVDSDGDGIPDSADTLPPGNLPPIAGKRVQSVAASGELLVKLPDASGFVSLKGSASLPVGSVIDARQGELTIASATNSGGTRASARLRNGIFRIRQARARGKATVSTDFVLTTPAGLSRACAPGKKPPAKGIVRTLSVTTSKGQFSTVGAAGTIKGQGAAWTVSDRCDGTLTQVKKGRVSVRAGKRTRTVRAGGRYLIKARLFAARRET